MKIKERIKQYIRKHHMLERSETVCIGLSGGADSVFLFTILLELSEELGIRVTAFHVNHCLRGEESDGDCDFVKALCLRNEVPLKVFSYDIAGIAKREKKGLEETGRDRRRKAAAEAADYFRASKIALAHHANDNAETVLFHLVRGSGADGLRGILPVNGPVIRPLLCVERSEIEDELRKRKIGWREDITNTSNDYSRNILRNQVIPLLKESVNPQAVRHINEAAADMAEAGRLINEAALLRMEQYSDPTEEGLLLRNGILTGKRLIDGKTALYAMEKITKSKVDLERIHADSLVRLFEKQVGRRIELPYKTTAEKVYEGVLIRENTVRNSPETESGIGQIGLPLNGEVVFGGLKIRTKLLDRADVPEKIPEKRYTKWLDYDKIIGHGFLRGRRPGDYLVIHPDGGRKKLKSYLIDEKVPRDLRDKLICLVNGDGSDEAGEVLWVIGCRIGETGRITGTTERVIEINVAEEESYEQ